MEFQFSYELEPLFTFNDGEFPGDLTVKDLALSLPWFGFHTPGLGTSECLKYSPKKQKDNLLMGSFRNNIPGITAISC